MGFEPSPVSRSANMTAPTAREAQLLAFLSGLPPGIARKLHDACQAAHAAGDESLPYEMICGALAEKAAQARSLAEHPYLGVADPLVTEDADAPQAAAILRSSLEPFEAFAEAVASELIADLKSGARPRLTGRGALGAALRSALYERLEDESKRRALTREMGGERAVADARTLVSLLCAEPELSESLFEIPDVIDELDAEILDCIREGYRTVIAKEPTAALPLMFILWRRLRRGWMILRIVRAVSNKQDDLLLSRTDFAVIGDILLNEAEAAADALQLDRRRPVDSDEVIDCLDRFVSITQGMTAELGIRKDGDWGRRLQHIRQEVAANMGELCEAAADAIEKAFPMERVRLDGNVPATRPRVAAEPDSEAIERAVALCDILNRCRKHANAATFVSARVRAFEDAERKLDDYASSMVDLIHESVGPGPAHLGEWVEHARRAVEALLGEESAAVFQRRASAASAKSSQDAA